MLLEKYIKEVVKSVIYERNQPNLLKKLLNSDLLIVDLNSKTMSEIYSAFHSKYLKDSFISVSSSSDGGSSESYDKNLSVEENKEIISENRFTLIKLKKNEKTVDYLENNFNFDFSNCSDDNKPIFCIPVSALSGDNSSSVNKKSWLLKKDMILRNQAIEELEDWNWATHDLHHGETGIATKGDIFIDPGSIENKVGLTYYNAPLSGYDYLDNQSREITNKSDKKENVISNYWLKIIGLYFNKIGFTKGVSRLDIWASIYSYCLNRMSSAEDAYAMDFKVVNEPGKRTLIIGKGEIKELQDFFASAYETVQKKSLLSNLEDGIIYIAHMF
tara:strand:+ start:46 stop:1035 length:990 start_codon:yes stop_codon:yes gene_type:complete